MLTGELPFPARIELCHWSQHAHPQLFKAIIATLRAAEEVLDGELVVQIKV